MDLDNVRYSGGSVSRCLSDVKRVPGFRAWAKRIAENPAFGDDEDIFNNSKIIGYLINLQTACRATLEALKANLPPREPDDFYIRLPENTSNVDTFVKVIGEILVPIDKGAQRCVAGGVSIKGALHGSVWFAVAASSVAVVLFIQTIIKFVFYIQQRQLEIESLNAAVQGLKSHVDVQKALENAIKELTSKMADDLAEQYKADNETRNYLNVMLKQLVEHHRNGMEIIPAVTPDRTSSDEIVSLPGISAMRAFQKMLPVSSGKDSEPDPGPPVF